MLAYTLNTVVTYGIGALGWWDLPSNAQLSAKYQSIVTPAGWAFAIWGIIFISQLVWVLHQQQRQPNGEECLQVQAVQYNYLWVCLAQVGWTVSFSLEHIGLSLFFMVLILIFLLRIVSALQPYGDYLLQKFPFSIHAAWIVAATAVNLNVVLVWLQSPVSVQFTAAVLSEVTLLLVALSVVWKSAKPDFTFPLVLVWALLGVHSQLSNDVDTSSERFSHIQIDCIRYGALAGVAVVLVSCLVRAIVLQRNPPSAEDHEESTYLRANE